MAIWGPDAEPRAGQPRFSAPPPSLRPAQRWWDIVLLPPLALGVSAVLLAAAAFSGTLVALARGVARDDVTAFLESQASTPLAVYGIEIAIYLCMVLVMLGFLAARGYRLRSAYFGAVRPLVALAAIVTGLLAAALAMYVLSLLPAGIQQLLVEQSELLMPKTPLETAVVFVMAVLLAPLVEELYFRGTVLRVLCARFPFIVAALVTSLFFSLMHGHLFILPGLGGWVLTGVLFIVGLLLAFWARLSGSLGAPVLMHAAYNAALFAPSLGAMFLDGQT